MFRCLLNHLHIGQVSRPNETLPSTSRQRKDITTGTGSSQDLHTITDPNTYIANVPNTQQKPTDIKPLKTKRVCFFYIRTQSVPRSKHSPPRFYKTNLIMFCKAKVAVCFEISTKYITQCEQHAEFWNIKPGGS
jgi:hypothetical protein